MKRELLVAIAVSALVYALISLFPALDFIRTALMSLFVPLLAASVLYGIVSLFYHSLTLLAISGEKRAHAFFMLLGFLTVPVVVIAARYTLSFSENALFASRPDMVIAMVREKMDRYPYLRNMPFKKKAEVIVAKMVAPAHIPSLSALKEAHMTNRELHKLIRYDGSPDRSAVDTLFASGDSELLQHVAVEVRTAFRHVVSVAMRSSDSQRCAALDQHSVESKVCDIIVDSGISPVRAAVHSLLNYLLYPLQTAFLALLFFYLLYSVLTVKTLSSSGILFLLSAGAAIVTQLPVTVPFVPNALLAKLSSIVVVWTGAVYRAILIAGGAAFILTALVFLYTVMWGRRR